jgi:aminocarboxymuconate-semialdehyde decarboxylase
MIIDVHAHLFPAALIDFYRQHGGDSVQVEGSPDDPALVQHGRMLHAKLPPPIRDADAHVAGMDASGADVHGISVPPPMYYWAEPEVGRDMCQLINDELAAAAAKHPTRLVPMCALPLQAPELAVEELRRIANDLGQKVVMIGSNVAGGELDAPELEQVFAEAAALGVAIHVHPIPTDNLGTRLFDYRLDLGLGMVLDTTMAMSRMVYSGIFDRLPDLTIGWSHMGGTAPFILDRMDYFQSHLPGSSSKAQGTFADYVDHFWYDTVVYSPRMLTMSLQVVPADRMMFGTDAPFMGDSTTDIRAILDGSDLLSEAERTAVYADNPAAFLRLGSDVLATAGAGKAEG